MATSFKEFAGSPVETCGPEGMKARRVLLCAWSDRGAVVELLLGDEYEFGGSTRAQYPDKPDIVAMRTRCEPFTDDVEPQVLDELTEGLNSYSGFAKLTVDYELLVPSQRNESMTVQQGTFLTYRQDSGREIVTLPEDALAWQDKPGETVSEKAVPEIRIPIVEHRPTWHRVVSPPWEAIRKCIGTVNDAEFMGAAAGTVLFDGAIAEPEFLRIDRLAEAKLGWRIEYVFREKAVKTGDGGIVGWNHAYRPVPTNDPGWDELADANGNRPYRSSGFSQLFEFAAE